MKSTTLMTQCLNHFVLICGALLVFTTNSFAQGSYGENPKYTFFKTQGLATSGSTVGNILFRYLHNGEYLPAGATIRAIAADNPLSDFLAMDLSFSTGITTLEERFRIMGNGNVGINTSNPGARLEVQQFATSDNLGNALLKVTGGQEDAPSFFSIYNHPNSRLQATLDGNLTVNKGNVTLTEGRLMVNTTEPLGNYVGMFNGSVIATEFWVKEYPNWPDYVFGPTYRLLSLAEVEAYIKAHGHLPNMPSAAEVAAGGFSMANLQAKSLEKIEELTLHLIAQEKAQEAYACEMETRVEELEARLAKLEQLLINAPK